MGVYGLWKLLEASGKPVPLETLEGKVLAIDISIWIYQVLQGYQDRHGTPRPNAHLLGLFVRICKLLYYKIKPVFVFDGGVPMLKKNTIASRRKQKSIATSKAQKMKADLINNLIKHSVVKTVLSKDSKVDENSGAMRIMINLQTKRPDEDMFVLPDMPSTSDAQVHVSDDDNASDTSVELSPRKQSKWIGNIHSVDVASGEFKALPADVRYDILTDLKETRKQNSWGRLHEMPQESHEFSGFQLKRLLKRRYVQESLESAEKEMGGKTLTLEELEKLLIEQGIDTKGREAAFRIAADSTTRLIYISDKNALAKCVDNNELEKDECDTLREANEEEFEPVAGPSNLRPIVENMNEYKLNDDSDDDVDVYIYNDSIAENMNEYALDSDWESECDMNESLALLSEKYLGTSKTNPALTYMLEYSGLSQKQIVHLLKHNKDESHENASKNIKTPEKDASFEFAEDEKTANSKPKLGLSENCEQTSKFTQLQIYAQDTCTTNDDTTVELISSEQKLDVIEIEPSKDTEISEITVTSNTINLDNKTTFEKHSSSIAKFNDEAQIDSSDSDSDDFVEIQDVPIPDVEIPRNIVKKENIEIIFKSDEKPEEDMFADIFEEANKNGVTPMNRLEQLLRDTNGEHKTLLIAEDSDNLKNSLLDTMPEVPLTEEAEIKSLENTSLTKNAVNVEDKAHNSQSSDEPIEWNKTSLLAQGNSFNECMQEKPVTLPANEEDLIELKEKLENEQEELTRDIGKLERQATNISDQIKIEAQELLRLFGIPYLVAPMEAEAQCAYLEQIKLTDGTITDDSDIWLFGGECVYKNFFNNNKKVLQFRACDIQHHFKLSRNQLIQLALLVGSDYTAGVTGIGPVTALEILAAFPAEGDNVLHGLHNFCSWIKKGRIAAPGKTGLRNKLRNVKLERDFPSQAVVQAYLFPTIDESKETFTWGKPNMVLLCDYTRQKFGWTKGKFDDTMIPILRRIEENKNQKLLDIYFKAKASTRSIEPSLSKRVQKAVRKLNNDDIEEANVDGKPQAKRSKKSDANQKSSKEENAVAEPKVSTFKPPSKISTTPDKPVKPIIKKIYTKEYIPQREKDKACALERKLHAIEVFRKSKQGLVKTKKVKCTTRKVKKEAELSESDSD
ncbi:DNA excision repair protein ERCC-5 isoform X2 [Linepithema humile]|uniref:DNA excision repair protein ERCC-5 isoform X2 n=1 Tax=Linepithema humile TaxID=83485 RepID=UPI00351E0D59